jgi:hypothetical protein
MNVPSSTERARFCVGESESYGRRGNRVRTLLLVESMSPGLNTSTRGQAIGEGVWTILGSTCEIIYCRMRKPSCCT